jgi:hypothetical protein
MSSAARSAADLFDMIRQKAPEYADLLTATTQDEFDEAFCPLLERALVHLEQNKKNFNQLTEEGLTAVLAASISVPGLTVTQETNSNGHVDITIDADHCTPTRRKLGEAKIYNGPAYHLAGLEQLLKRYTSGREGRGILLVYCKAKDIAGKVKNIRAEMDQSLPQLQQGQTSDHKLKWSFRSRHSHSSGELVEVDHVSCNLCAE